MAGPEPDQQAHAQRIRELTQARRESSRAGPEQNIAALVSAEVARLLPAAVAAEIAKLQISAGQGISISGKLPNITIAATPPTARTFTGTMDCSTDPPTVTLTG